MGRRGPPQRYSQCTAEGCEKNDHLVRGLCGAHYQRWKRYGDPNYVRPALGHGHSMYRNRGCRCDVCTSAASAYHLAWEHDPAHPERLERKRVLANVRRGRPPETKFRPALHGCSAGVNQHRVGHEPYCEDCRKFMAYRKLMRERTARANVHGTSAAMRQHYRLREPPCDLCREGFNASERRRHAELKAMRHAAMLADLAPGLRPRV